MEVEQCPEGDSGMAAFLDSDENFMMFRRFGWCQFRLLLRKQKEIEDMEKDLECQDNYFRDAETREDREGISNHREGLLSDLEAKLTEYSIQSPITNVKAVLMIS